MADSVQNVTQAGLASLIAKGVSDGVSAAFAKQNSIEANKADHDAMMEQHLSQTKQKKVDATVNQVADLLQSASETQQSLTELYASVSKSLSMMSNQPVSPLMIGPLVQMASASSTNEMSLKSSAPVNAGPVGSAFRNYSSSNSSVAPTQTPYPVDSSQGYQEAISAPVPVEKNDYDASNKKALADEEDRLFKEAARPVMPKLSRALDMYLEGQNSSVNNNGSSNADGSILSLLAAMGGGVIGFAMGYVGKLASMWKAGVSGLAKDIKAGWDAFKKTKVGTKISELGTKFKNAVSGGIQKIGELGTKVKSVFTDGISKISEMQSSFSKMIAGWKNTMKESTLGKVASKVAETAKSAGGLLAKLAKKAGSSILSGAKSLGGTIMKGVKAAGKAVANSGVAKKAIQAAKFGAKLGSKIPVIQAAGTALDTAVNIYKAAQNGASMKDMVRMGVAGAFDAVSDAFMVPELMNAASGAIDAAVKGKGLDGIIKGAGSGLLKERDANEISFGNALAAKTMNLVGAGDESTRAIAKASNQGLGWKEAGFDVVSGAAAGFGHSAAVYRPKAYGSMENSKTPTASVVPNLPTETPMSEADKMKTLVESVTEGVKAGMLSPEVQEANAKNAKETGAAINGQLFGG